jgi:YVTN family beta-propeller protein
LGEIEGDAATFMPVRTRYATRSRSPLRKRRRSWSAWATLSTALGVLYMAAGATVTPIDLATKTAGTPIPVGHHPVAVAITPDGKTAYVVNSGNPNYPGIGFPGDPGVELGSVTPIDTKTNTPGSPTVVDYGARAIAIAPDGGAAYVTADGDEQPGDPADITPIDTTTTNAGPRGGCGEICVGIVITPNGKRGYATDAGGFVEPLKLPYRELGPSIAIGGGAVPQGIAIAPDGKTAYVALLNRSAVVPLDLDDTTFGHSIAVGASPWAIAVNPDGKSVYVTNSGDGTVTPIDTQTNKPGKEIAVGASPQGIAIAPDGVTAYVTNSGDGTVTPINTRTGKPGAPIPVGASPQGIAITPDLRPPQTTISRKPANPHRKVSIFRLTSSDANSSFECSLDAKRFKKCGAVVIYRKLAAGDHIFRARATDLAGNVDPTPAKVHFHIRRRRVH